MFAFDMAPLMAIEPSSGAVSLASDFWNEPVGVLMAETITTCCDIGLIHVE